MNSSNDPFFTDTIKIRIIKHLEKLKNIDIKALYDKKNPNKNLYFKKKLKYILCNIINILDTDKNAENKILIQRLDNKKLFINNKCNYHRSYPINFRNIFDIVQYDKLENYMILYIKYIINLLSNNKLNCYEFIISFAILLTNIDTYVKIMENTGSTQSNTVKFDTNDNIVKMLETLNSYQTKTDHEKETFVNEIKNYLSNNIEKDVTFYNNIVNAQKQAGGFFGKKEDLFLSTSIIHAIFNFKIYDNSAGGITTDIERRNKINNSNKLIIYTYLYTTLYIFVFVHSQNNILIKNNIPSINIVDYIVGSTTSTDDKDIKQQQMNELQNEYPKHDQANSRVGRTWSTNKSIAILQLAESAREAEKLQKQRENKENMEEIHELSKAEAFLTMELPPSGNPTINNPKNRRQS